MKAFKIPTFNERLGTAANAKKAELARYRARSPANDPAVAERRASRQVLSNERELLAAERAAAKRADDERLEIARATREIAEKLEREERQLREANEQEVLAAQNKAARDARYAARKSRKQ